MKELLSIESEKYGKRLAKEIRGILMSGVGVYFHGSRVIGATFSNGQLNVKQRDGATWQIWHGSYDALSDGYGRSICAARS